MAITYPLPFPAITGITTFGMGPVSNVAIAESQFNFTTEAQVWDGQRFVIEISVQPLLDAREIRLMKAFLASLNGREGTFLYGDAAAPLPAGVATGTPLADTDVSPATNRVRDKQLYTKGWTPDTPGILLTGDYLQIGSGASSRLIMNLTDADSDSSGLATLNVWPALQSDIADDTPITVINPRGVFRMLSNAPRWNVNNSIQHGFSIQAAAEV